MLVKFCHSVPSNNLTELHPYSETTDNGRLSFIMALYFHCIFSSLFSGNDCFHKLEIKCLLDM